MRVICRHGHFAFYPRKASDIGAFANRYSLEIERVEDFFTFSFLAQAGEYSIEGKNYLNLPAVATYAGKPWEIMKANGFVYDLSTNLLVPKISVTTLIDPARTGLYFTAQTPIIQSGSRNIAGNQILSYDAEFDMTAFILRVREYSYD